MSDVDWWDVLTPDPIPLFVELCAGTAAVSLRLADPKGRPPVSRMGSKTGYADAILRHLGLQPGQGALQYLWCEPDEGCRLLLEAYRDPELAREAAEIIRSWAAEDPRELWDRLRAEGPPQGVTVREGARWMWVQGHGDSSKPPRLAAPYRMPEGNAQGQWRAPPSTWLADRTVSLPHLPAGVMLAAGTPEDVCSAMDVAKWVWMQRRSAHGKTGQYRESNETHCISPSAPAEALCALPHVMGDAQPFAIAPEVVPVGTVVLIDPPYVKTTGYAHNLPRSEVERLALAWAAAGAIVAICEQEPIVLPGWTHVEISGERRGQKRTFSKQQDEWLTIWKPQSGLGV